MNTFHARGITSFSELLSEDDPSGNRLEISLTELRTHRLHAMFVLLFELYTIVATKNICTYHYFLIKHLLSDSIFEPIRR